MPVLPFLVLPSAMSRKTRPNPPDCFTPPWQLTQCLLRIGRTSVLKSTLSSWQADRPAPASHSRPMAHPIQTYLGLFIVCCSSRVFLPGAWSLNKIKMVTIVNRSKNTGCSRWYRRRNNRGWSGRGRHPGTGATRHPLYLSCHPAKTPPQRKGCRCCRGWEGAAAHCSVPGPRHLHQLDAKCIFTMDRKSTCGRLAAAMEWVYWKLILSDGHDWI